MDISAHKRTLAIVHLIAGIFNLLLLGGATVFFSIFFPFIQRAIEEEGQLEGLFFVDIFSGFIYSVIIVSVLLTALPSIIGAIALLKDKAYGLVLLMISGCISLLSFPLGTAVGVYTIWVYVQQSKEKSNAQTE